MSALVATRGADITAAVPSPTMTLRVAARDIVADGVVSLSLVDDEGADLPAWAPGAHIDVIVGPDLVRQYSLCGDPDDRSVWRIAVLREPDGRGGSAHIHDHVDAGALVTVSRPRNHFELVPAERYLFIAGGIGITPILAMVGAAQAGSARWRLHYGGRNRQSMAFRDELSERFADKVTLHPQDEVGLLDLASIIGEPRPDTLIYCCGPGALLDAVQEFCRDWPAGSVRMERFAPRQSLDSSQDTAFDVELARSGRILPVPPGRTVLDVVRGAGVPVPSSCEEGTCGTCEVSVLDGQVDHRDSILSDEEQDANDTMFVCVSRARCPRLVLDL